MIVYVCNSLFEFKEKFKVYEMTRNESVKNNSGCVSSRNKIKHKPVFNDKFNSRKNFKNKRKIKYDDFQ